MTTRIEKLIIALMLMLVVATGCAIVDPLRPQAVTNFDQLVLEAASEPALDVTGSCIDLDDDNDTSICADTDDQIDFELGGADVFVFADAPAAGAGGDLLDITDGLAIMDGSDTVLALDINLTNANHTGTANVLTGIELALGVQDAQAVETGVIITGGDYAIDVGNLPVIATAQYWFDDFLGDAVFGQYTEISGADGQAVQTIVQEQYGVYQLTSGDVGDTPVNDLEAITLSLEWQADQGSLVMEVRLHMDTAVTTSAMCIGFNDDVSTVEMPFKIVGTTVTSNAANAVAFCFDTDADTDEWYFLGVDGDTDATGNAITGRAPVADAYQVFRIEIDAGGEVARGYINGVLEGELTANAVLITALLAPWIGVDSHTNASRIVDIDYIYVSAGRG